MRYVAIRIIVLSVFVANISTLLFLNNAKTLSIIAISCTLVVIVAGGVLAHYGFANIELGYLISANMAAGLSTLCVGV